VGERKKTTHDVLLREKDKYIGERERERIKYVLLRERRA
jgi:hypothetical protein